MRWLAALAIAAMLLVSCSDSDKKDQQQPRISGTCGLPKVSEKVEPDRVPDEFVLENAEIARTRDFRGRFIATVNAPYQVTQAFKVFREQAADAGWETVSEENEGFEAELYLADKDQLAAIQIRTSTCKNKIIVFVSTIPRDSLPGN